VTRRGLSRGQGYANHRYRLPVGGVGSKFGRNYPIASGAERRYFDDHQPTVAKHFAKQSGGSGEKLRKLSGLRV